MVGVKGKMCGSCTRKKCYRILNRNKNGNNFLLKLSSVTVGERYARM
jgi:hypothetical protein